MALDLPLDPHDTGLPARYWRVTSVQLDHLRQAATVWLHGWADAMARHHGRSPAASLTLSLAAADFAGGLHAADTASVYAALRSVAMRGTDRMERAAAPGCENTASLLADARDC